MQKYGCLIPPNRCTGDTLYAVATLAGSPLHQRLEADRLISLAVPFGRGDGRLLVFLARAIRQAGYRVVDAHNVQSQFWGHLAALVAGAPKKISTVHSAYKLEHAGSLKGRLYEQVLRLNAHWGAQFVAVSEAVQSYLQGLGIHAERIALIHNSLPLPGSLLLRREKSTSPCKRWAGAKSVCSDRGRPA